jgi:hypothetical protein
LEPARRIDTRRFRQHRLPAQIPNRRARFSTSCHARAKQKCDARSKGLFDVPRRRFSPCAQRTVAPGSRELSVRGPPNDQFGSFSRLDRLRVDRPNRATATPRRARPRIRNAFCISEEAGGMRMTYEESLQWLDENGGVWSVRATGSDCAVIASLGKKRVVASSAQLTAESVERALVHAVALMQSGQRGRLSGPAR